MTLDELFDAIARYPFLLDGLPDHADEVVRIAARLVVEEQTPIVAPDLPDSAPQWENDFWARRAERQLA